MGRARGFKSSRMLVVFPVLYIPFFFFFFLHEAWKSTPTSLGKLPKLVESQARD